MLVTGEAGFIASDFIYYYRTIHPNSRIIDIDAFTCTGNTTKDWWASIRSGAYQGELI
ncbi:hypothetical protein [Paenibacillus glycinis]|uniref:Uncharacterized protein n=1 Tax=Paenibacillus glycinis TaxID=2697035 RepID=A0ABW9XXX7_9BACL|nr:hypothetical protein [Paenibacillus glycinis]NBD27570.1 hypothetical protein [Paenibacillus glycinis]